MSENPFGTLGASSLHWLALVVLGLAAGYALRVAARPAEASGATSGIPPAAAISRTDPAAAGPGSSSRMPRTPSRQIPASPGPPLTAAQAEALLAQPDKYRFNLDQVLAGQATPAAEGRWLPEFFEWDESHTRQVFEALEAFRQNVRAMIDSRALADAPEPGVIHIDYSPLADDYRKQVDQLFVAIEDAIGTQGFRQLDSLGILRQVENAITPETHLTLRLGPGIYPQHQGGGYTVNFTLQDGEDNVFKVATATFNPQRPEDLLRIDFLARLPPIDWEHQIQRAYEANPR